jgi:hypothetical protein
MLQASPRISIKSVEDRLKVCLFTIFACCRRFDPGGSLDRRVNLSLRVPAQMGWREMEHKGETRSHQGGVLVVGVTSVRERERESEPVR